MLLTGCERPTRSKRLDMGCIGQKSDVLYTRKKQHFLEFLKHTAKEEDPHHEPIARDVLEEVREYLQQRGITKPWEEDRFLLNSNREPTRCPKTIPSNESRSTNSIRNPAHTNWHPHRT